LNKANVAVVGCGYWGKNLVRVFHELGALAMVCDADAARAKEFAAKYGVEAATSLDQVLARGDVKAVVLSTPAVTHAESARKALLAGKDVFVEKPLALDAKEGRELVALAERLGRILMVGHLLHYHGAVRRLKELVGSGELGRVRYIYSNRLNLGKIRREENILWSFAPHDLSVILSLAKEMPEVVACQGGAYMHERIADVTVSTMTFASGLRAHVFVSWLHPYKEQKLIVVGEQKMAVFDDVEPKNKLVIYPHHIDWKDGMPVPVRADAEPVEFDREEPLRAECLHFIGCVEHRTAPLTDGREGNDVLTLLEALQVSLSANGAPQTVGAAHAPAPTKYFVHPTATVDEPVEIGEGVKIWHYTHISRDCVLGAGTNVGQNVFVAPGVRIGKNVKIQNNVSVYQGVEVADDVFLGPSAVFTNVLTPRSHVNRKNEFASTLVGRGATVGANATVVCGHDIGAYALVGAGAVVASDVAPHAVVVGNPARAIGWACRCGERLPDALVCGHCGDKYRERDGHLSLVS
jgi:UDP-2-acetamido-3-amino-2,3-dideoxy-glucuronate N-acetyltransferase